MIIFISDSEKFIPSGKYSRLCEVDYDTLDVFIDNLSKDSTVILDTNSDSELLRKIKFNIFRVDCNVVLSNRDENLEVYRNNQNVHLIKLQKDRVIQYVKKTNQLRLGFTKPE